MAVEGWGIRVRGFIYRRPYEDKWGVLHDPTTEWDERLKYYQHWVLLKVSEATRKKARPADVAAQALLREEQRLQEAQRLEADYLEWANRRKQWKRRRKHKHNHKRKRTQRQKLTQTERRE